jgi:hypothetical protein
MHPTPAVTQDQPAVTLMGGPHRQGSASPTAAGPAGGAGNTAGNARYGGAPKPGAGMQAAPAQTTSLQQQQQQHTVPQQQQQHTQAPHQQHLQLHLTPRLSGPGMPPLTPQELLPRVSGPGLPQGRGTQGDGLGPHQLGVSGLLPALGDSGLLPQLGDSGLQALGESGLLPDVVHPARQNQPPVVTGPIPMAEQGRKQSHNVTHIHSSHAPVTPVHPEQQLAVVAVAEAPAPIPGLSPASAASAAEMVGGLVW